MTVEDVGPEPRLGRCGRPICHAAPHPLQRPSPARPATAAAVARSSSGYGSPLARMRAGREWAVNTTLVSLGIAASASRDGARPGTRRRPARAGPALDAGERRRRAPAGGGRPARGTRRPTSPSSAERAPAPTTVRRPPGERVDRAPRSTARRASCPSTTANRPGARSSRAACDRVALRLGALRPAATGRRWPRTGAVRSASCSGVGRPAAADVGVVRLDLGRGARGVPYAISSTPTGAPSSSGAGLVHVRRRSRPSTPGSVSGSTPWPRLKTCPGRPALSASTASVPAERRRPSRRARAPGRGCPGRRRRRRGGGGRRRSACASRRPPRRRRPRAIDSSSWPQPMPKWIAGHVRVGGEPGEHPARVGQHVALVVAPASSAPAHESNSWKAPAPASSWSAEKATARSARRSSSSCHSASSPCISALVWR